MQDRLITIQITEDSELRLRTKVFNSTEEDEDEGNVVDMDRLLQIDMMHLEAELVTFPVVLNQLGLALAEVTSNHNLAKLNLEIYAAQARERIRKAHIDDEEEVVDAKGKTTYKKPKPLSLDEVEARLSMDIKYQTKKRLLYQRQKEMDMLNGLYWSAKSKDDKLNKLSMSIQAGDVYDNLANSKIKRINNVDISDIKPTRR